MSNKLNIDVLSPETGIFIEESGNDDIDVVLSPETGIFIEADGNDDVNIDVVLSPETGIFIEADGNDDVNIDVLLKNEDINVTMDGTLLLTSAGNLKNYFENPNSLEYLYVGGDTLDELYSPIGHNHDNYYVKDIIPFTTTATPTIANYQTNYAAAHGENPIIALRTIGGDGNITDRSEQPKLTMVNGLISSISWDLPDAETGFIILN